MPFTITWQLILDGQDFLELLLIFDDENVCATVFGDVLASLGRVGRVDAGGDSAGKDRAQICQKPFRRIESEDADAVEPLKPEFDEGFGDSASL